MNRKIAFIGGGLREEIAADIIINEGFKIYPYFLNHRINRLTLGDCLYSADTVFLPVRSNFPDGSIPLGNGESLKLKAKDFSVLNPDAVIYGGAFSDILKAEIKKGNRKLKQYMEDDAIAVPNAELTAEGTLYRMMDLSLKSRREWKTAILGFGRVGYACARLFANIGMKSVVFCRSEADYRRGRQHGFDMRYYSGLAVVAPHLDFLINTVPAPVVTEKVLRALNQDTAVIDLAANPGGTDFDFAAKAGINAILLPGVPGNYAPVSAGKILGRYYLSELAKGQKGGLS